MTKKGRTILAVLIAAVTLAAIVVTMLFADLKDRGVLIAAESSIGFALSIISLQVDKKLVEDFVCMVNDAKSKPPALAQTPAASAPKPAKNVMRPVPPQWKSDIQSLADLIANMVSGIIKTVPGDLNIYNNVGYLRCDVMGFKGNALCLALFLPKRSRELMRDSDVRALQRWLYDRFLHRAIREFEGSAILGFSISVRDAQTDYLVGIQLKF